MLNILVRAEGGDEQKASLIFSFIKNIEWTHPARKDRDAPFIIGVSGNDLLADLASEYLKSSPVKNRVATVRKLATVKEAAECHMLVICGFDEGPIGDMLAEAYGKGILTVGESDEFLRAGGIIQFVKRKSTGGVGYRVEKENAKREGLYIKGFLLHNAADQ